jgi:hypothetical protein
MDDTRLARRTAGGWTNCRGLAPIGGRGFDRRLAPPFAVRMGDGGG